MVAGMSGSPVYFEGKLAGALSLKLGQFTKEAIGGVTPIQDMFEIEKSQGTPTSGDAAGAGWGGRGPGHARAGRQPGACAEGDAVAAG